MLWIDDAHQVLRHLCLSSGPVPDQMHRIPSARMILQGAEGFFVPIAQKTQHSCGMPCPWAMLRASTMPLMAVGNHGL